MMHCPCGSTKIYNDCCGLYIDAGQMPPNPEALMRSRYAAFALAKMDYIVATMKGPVAKDFDPNVARERSKQTKWLGLEIKQAPPVAENALSGTVEFVARYLLAGREHVIHEISEFQREADHWYYVSGEMVGPSTAFSKDSKVGRNEPCPCGSGKKYKKCCSSA